MIINLPDESLKEDKLLYYLYMALKNRISELEPATPTVAEVAANISQQHFDLDAIYNKYPKKLGKARGMKKLKSIIKSQKTYDDMLIAVENYALTVRDSKPEYIKLFSTFVNGDWQDYVPDASTSAKKKVDWGF